VLIVSSASALVHTPLMAAYTASKAGAEAFGDALRAEVAHTGTKVGVAYFSFIDTDMVRNAFDRPSAARAREMGGPFSKVAPLSEAIDAIERGITTRARTVVAPRSVRPMLVLRTLLQPLSEFGLRRDKRFLETLRMAEAEDVRAHDPAAAGLSGATGSVDGGAPARSAAAVSASVPAAIASRRSRMSRAR
jgi:NAD(P)-dependent dehydrogenase (short-subunit alcohol dehydrogenase family)